MSARESGEDFQLGEKNSLETGRSDFKPEQEQGLLTAWEKGDSNESGEEQSHAYIDRGGLSTTRLVAICVAALFVVLFGAGYFLGLPRIAREKVEAALGVQTNDYVLDPSWDYDAPAQRREYSWTIRDRLHNPDGIYRPMMLVNNQFPGPLIEVNEGDTIVVHIQNRAVNATSIHWHGIYQNGTPHMDGTVGVTQCAIAPGGKFTYEYTVSGQSGTYWWHAHQGVQSSDGVHGPLVVHGRRERELQRIPYDTDRVLLISDHYHDLSSALLWQYLKPDMENDEPVPENGLLNGRNVRNCDDFPGRKCDNTSAHVSMPQLDLAPNQRHRLRLVNVGAFAEFQVQIDEHELAVTEVDGTDVEPKMYHRVNINPAQRYSVVVNTNVTTADSFWFRARMVTKCFRAAPKTLDPDLLAVVRYYPDDAEEDEVPISQDWGERLELQCRDMNTTELTPAEVIATPLHPDAFFFLRANFEIGNARLARGFFNSSSWRADAKSPSLLRAIDGLSTANSTFHALSDASPQMAFVNDRAFEPARELVIQTSGIQTIDLLIHNFDDGNHPLHLHGYKYFVLASGHGYPPTTHVGADMNLVTLAPLYDSLDVSNPLRRDTASVEAYGWILLRVVTDNPGAWAFHCHISWHTEAGLMMQLLTGTDALAGMEVSRGSQDLCAATGIQKGMGPDDEDYWDLAK